MTPPAIAPTGGVESCAVCCVAVADAEVAVAGVLDAMDDVGVAAGGPCQYVTIATDTEYLTLTCFDQL